MTGLRERLLAPPTGVVDVVIDTDATNQIDDQFAIVWAMLRPDKLNLLALHACPYAGGPDLLRRPGFLSEVDRAALESGRLRTEHLPVVEPAEGVVRAAAECRRFAELVGVDVPVIDGATSMMISPDTPVRSDATDHLIELAHQDREGPLYVLGIGCATNFASAVLLDPTIRERIVVVWTSAYPSFWPRANASFNLAGDLAAARALLESGVPLTYLPTYYVGEQLRLSVPELAEYVRGRGRVGAALWDLCASSASLGSAPGTSKVIWDLVTVAWVLDPSSLPSHVVPTPRLDEQLHWADAGPGRHVMREAYAVNRDAVIGDFFQVLASQPEAH